MNAEHNQIILNDVRNSNVIAFMSDQGATSLEIKKWIISTLQPLYRNQDVLNDLAVDVLAPEAVRIFQLSQDRWAFDVLTNVLDIYRKSDASGHEECLRICAEWNDSIFQGLSAYWSIYRLREPPSSLNIVDRVFQQFRTIGALLEGALLSRFRELLCQVRHTRSKDYTYNRVLQLKFGNVVRELLETASLSNACRPEPWHVSLSQWRNVSQHHSYRCFNGQIEIQYGEPPHEKFLSMTPNELNLLEMRIASVLNAMEAARTAFAFDNPQSFADAIPRIELRQEAHLVQLSSALSTQGFCLRDVQLDHCRVHAEIQDVRGGDRTERLVHASQFLPLVWQHFPTESVHIRFRSFDQAEDCEFTCDGLLCQEIYDGKKTLVDLARGFKFRPHGQ